MKPGSSAFVQVLLEDKTVLVPGDRFILRQQTPMITLGGGRTLDNGGRRQAQAPGSVIARRFEGAPRSRRRSRKIPAASHFPHADTPKSIAALCAETGLRPDRAANIAANVARSGEAVALTAASDFLSAVAFKKIADVLVEHIKAYIKEHPALAGIERPELRRRLEKDCGEAIAEFFDDILVVMKQTNRVQVDSNTVSLPGRDRTLEGDLAKQANLIEAAYMTGALTPPNRADLETQLKIAPKIMREIFKYLHDTGKLVDASPEVTFHRASVDAAKAKLKELFEQGAERTTSEIRQHLGMNRKFAVPLVELLDKEKFTVRTGDVRKKL